MKRLLFAILSVLLIVFITVPVPASGEVGLFPAFQPMNKTVSGRVIDLQGNGVSGVTILAVLDNLNTYLPFVAKSGSGTSAPASPPPNSGRNYYTVETDANGYYTLDSLPPGRYKISARKVGMDFNPIIYSVNTSTGGSGYNFQQVVIPTVYTPGTINLSQETLNQLISVSEDGKTFTFATETSDLGQLHTGDVIIGGISALTPEGFLRKVVSITSNGSQRIIVTEPATLEDAFQSLSINTEQRITPQSLKNFMSTPGITLLEEPSLMGSQDFKFELRNVVLYDVDNNLLTTNDQIVADGQLLISPNIEFDIRIEGMELQELYYTTSMKVESGFTITSRINSTLSLEMDLIPPWGIPVTVGPVVLVPTIQLVGGITGSVSSNTTTSINNTSVFTAGLWHVNNQTKSLSNYTSKFSFIPVTGYSTNSFEAFIGPKLSIKIYGIVGGYVKAGFAVNLKILPLIPSLDLKGGLIVSVGIDASIGIFTLLNLERRVIEYWITLIAVHPSASSIKEIDIGNEHACLLTNAGMVYCWGNNRFGQLGDGTQIDRSSPVPVYGLSNVSTIKVGGYHTCASTNNGMVYCWGANSFGQLGVDLPASFTPKLVNGLSSVIMLSAGENHTCALVSSGTVKCWGDNSAGQLGNNTSENSSAPVPVVGLSGVTGVYSGGDHTCAVVLGGAVKCWGRNTYGQLGNNTNTSSSIPVPVFGLNGVTGLALGDNHTCAVTFGTVKCWGRNDFGALGVDTTNRSTPITVDGLLGVTSVVAGANHTCALTNLGISYCWGNNYAGQLGDGTTIPRFTPLPVSNLDSGYSLAAGGNNTCIMENTNIIKCWGDNTYGQLGDGSLGYRTIPILSRFTNVRALSAYRYHSCLLTDAGMVYCWGDNSYGQIGDGTNIHRTNPVLVEGLSNITAISTGAYHTCALTNSGLVYCWGRNDYGQLGDGTNIHRTNPVLVEGLSDITAISTGAYHTCVLTNSGVVYCWGQNSYGQLGDGTITNRTNPVLVEELSEVITISAGYYHTCATVSMGSVYCWGNNWSGQLGDGTFNAHTNPILVNGLANVMAITAGYYHSCALKNTGEVYCWGDNSLGQLGDGTVIDRTLPVISFRYATAIVAGGFHVCVLSNTGSVYCWGSNEYGQLGNGTVTVHPLPYPVNVGELNDVVSLFAGDFHSCALNNVGALKCWGSNWYGQLGDGSIGYRPVPAPVVGLP